MNSRDHPPDLPIKLGEDQFDPWRRLPMKLGLHVDVSSLHRSAGSVNGSPNFMTQTH